MSRLFFVVLKLLLTLVILAAAVWGTAFLLFRLTGATATLAAIAFGIAALAGLIGIWTSDARLPLGFAIVFVGLLSWWSSFHPSHDRDWIPELARLPTIAREGEVLTVSNLRHFRWRTEAMIRSFDALSGHLPGEESENAGEHGEEHPDKDREAHPRGGSLNEFGISTSVVYGLGNGFELGVRGDFVSGISRAGLDERFRISPAITYYLNESRTMFLRAQYNWDHSGDFGSAHGVWAQIGINWGGPEVR